MVTPASNTTIDGFFTDTALNRDKFSEVMVDKWTYRRGEYQERELQSTGLPLYTNKDIDNLRDSITKAEKSKVTQAVNNYKKEQLKLSEIEAQRKSSEGRWPAQNSEYIATEDFSPEYTYTSSRKTSFLVKKPLSTEQLGIEPVAEKVDLIFKKTKDDFKSKLDESAGKIFTQRSEVTEAKREKTEHKIRLCMVIITLTIGCFFWAFKEKKLANNIRRQEEKLSELESSFKSVYAKDLLERKHLINENKDSLLENLDHLIKHTTNSSEKERFIKQKNHLEDYIIFLNKLPGQADSLPKPTQVAFTDKTIEILTDRHLYTECEYLVKTTDGELNVELETKTAIFRHNNVSLPIKPS